jgi:hypothetical protein
MAKKTRTSQPSDAARDGAPFTNKELATLRTMVRDVEKKSRAQDAAAEQQSSSDTSAEKTEQAKALKQPTPEFANGRQLAKAIAEKCDLVTVGSELLTEGEAKGASVRARMFETTVEYLYGKPAAAPAAPTEQFRVVLDMPCPDRDKLPE